MNPLEQLEQTAFQLTQDLLQQNTEIAWSKLIASAERGILRAALQQARGNQTAAAACLRKNRNTLRERIARHRLNV
ncbi:helix-turn-helix domain-containing protein [Thiolinea disciformis]|uniref:helix-turn-helix domain-containing protein n=1 Tax=Thiolinea disciformis TaxID=125614 RepID=UPI00037C1E67|nr:helix-turn-helix domain-containing protein [Thiolinea disciformis]